MIYTIIQFNNQIFKTRINTVDFGEVLISTISLNNILFNEDDGYISEGAELLDESIFYFVKDDYIDSTDDKIELLLKNEVL